MILTNFHTHTKYCDGSNTCEEVIQAAIKNGMKAIGFSGHGYTSFDHDYCMLDTRSYLQELTSLREKYKEQISVFIGIEEDCHELIDRDGLDYIIGSSHYLKVDGAFLPIDLDLDGFKRCLRAYDNDVVRLAEDYYKNLCDYILMRKPDIIGHFDLITKFDEMDESLFLSNPAYNKVAEKYIALAAQSGAIFEVNTGAISRGYRSSPYPAKNLLAVLRELNAKVILSSDSHSKDTLLFGFEEARALLDEIGITNIVSSPINLK